MFSKFKFVLLPTRMIQEIFDYLEFALLAILRENNRIYIISPGSTQVSPKGETFSSFVPT